MAIKNEDFLLVNRDTVPHKTKFSTFVSDTIHVGDNPPNAERTTPGSLWYCTADGRFYTYVDAGIPNWIEAAPPFGFPVINLNYIPAVDSGTINISGEGTDATISIVSSTFAGLMSPTQLSQLDSATALDLEAVTTNGNTTKAGIVFNADTGTVVPEDGAIKGADGEVVINNTNKLTIAEPLNARIAFAFDANNLSDDVIFDSVNVVSVNMRSTGHSSQDVNVVYASLNADTESTDVSLFKTSVTSAATNNTPGAHLVGYYSNIAPSRVPNGQSFNFYAGGNSPSFYESDVYIGGVAARNTYELWKSTLTEEQQEQLAAGTLAIPIPANVSTPGDGSFARQWWYDRQSAAAQALIDSGELEYPEHLQAANFVDTFDFGGFNNINLLSTGLGEFTGGVKVLGGDEDSVECGIVAEDTYRIKLVANSKNYLDINRYGNIHSDADIDQETSANYVNFYSRPALTTQRTAGETLSVSNFKSQLQSFTNPNGAKIVYRAFWATNLNSNIVDGTADEVYGFFSNVSNQTTSGQVSYNFYASATAPNYFAGDVQVGANTLNDSWIDTNQDGAILGPNYLHLFTKTHDPDVCNLNLRRTGNTYPAKVIKFSKGPTEVGDISVVGTSDTIAINGLAGGPLIIDNGADARNITETAAIANASAVIQQLNPVRINNERFGFTAADLQPVVSEAVVGTADETTPIGTHTDAEGVVTTDVTEPEAIPLGETWVQTGTRPVYQGVDQTKLIPLLTKALQEALEEIDSLKSRVATLEG